MKTIVFTLNDDIVQVLPLSGINNDEYVIQDGQKFYKIDSLQLVEVNVQQSKAQK